MGGERMSFYGKCPNCGHCAPKKLSKTSKGFGAEVIRVASDLTGVTQKEIRSNHSKKEYRPVKWAVAHYLHQSGLSWASVGRVMRRSTTGAFNLSKEYGKEDSDRIYRMLLEAIEVTD